MVLTRKQVIAKLKEAQGDDSLRIFGQKVDVTASYISDIYLGRRAPGPKILKFLGLEVAPEKFERTYRKVVRA